MDVADVAGEVRALVADLLPVLAPHAMLDSDSGLLVLPVGTAHADISLDGLVTECAALPHSAWPTRVQAWLAEKAAQVSRALAERDRLRVQITPRLPRRERRRLVCTPHGNLLDIVVLYDGQRLTREACEQLAVPNPGRSAIEATLHFAFPALSTTDDGTVRVISGPYATSALLDPPRFLPPGPMLVALPRYSEILACPAEADAARQLAERARRSRLGAADPCDDRLLWYHDSVLRRVRISRLTGRPILPS
jgi:hypothetical protein